MVPSYGPLEAKQLWSETFFSPGLGFRDIRLDRLKWATLYITAAAQPDSAVLSHTAQMAICRLLVDIF